MSGDYFVKFLYLQIIHYDIIDLRCFLQGFIDKMLIITCKKKLTYLQCVSQYSIIKARRTPE